MPATRDGAGTDGKTGRSNKVGYAWRNTLETSHQTTIWWDWFRQDADAIFTLYAQDAQRISVRDRSRTMVEQRVYAFDDRRTGKGPKAVCDILNNVWPSKIELRITFENGAIVGYERSSKDGMANAESIPIEVHDVPTRQYAEAYAFLVANPALYLLCARAPSPNTWFAAAQRASWEMPRHILRWLYRKVRQGG